MTHEKQENRLAANDVQPFAEIVKTADGLDELIEIFQTYWMDRAAWPDICEENCARRTELVGKCEDFSAAYLSDDERAALYALKNAALAHFEKVEADGDDPWELDVYSPMEFNWMMLIQLGLVRAREKIGGEPWQNPEADEPGEAGIVWADMDSDPDDGIQFVDFNEAHILDRAA